MKRASIMTREWRRLSLAAALLAALPASAAERFELYRTVFQIPERGPVTGYALVDAKWTFTFLAPSDWAVGASRERREVTLAKSDSLTKLSFRLPAAGKAVEPATTTLPLRERVQERFPGARIVREFACFAAGSAGTAFDLEVPGDKDTTLDVRLAFVTLASGPVEFQLSTASGKAEPAFFDFACLMTSFHLTAPKNAREQIEGNSDPHAAVK